MSGTSADGVDAAVLDLAVAGCGGYRGVFTHAFEPALRTEVLAANGPLGVEAMAQLDRRLGACYARVAREAVDRLGPVDFIALHGQTIRHQPRGEPGFTLQIGAAADIAVATGLTVVHDFRRTDVAAGGEGAPLVPPFHQYCFQDEQPRLVLNLGGMANVTWLPGTGDPRPLLAFDCGPGNVLMDAAVELCSAGQATCDVDGRLAAAGQCDVVRLEEWLDHVFFRQAPPKSTGRETFGMPLVTRWWSSWRGSAADFLATLTALTAESVARAVRAWTPGAAEMLVFGGGAENQALMQALQDAMKETRVLHGGRHSGIPGQALEALAFAWLGSQCLLGKRLDLERLRGRQHPMILGNILPGDNWPDLLVQLSQQPEITAREGPYRALRSV
ncbi:anhydro-N-acetylmuramic acid kinase [Acidithiobacillus sp. GGI-221]|nr:anhydro-N-acetylmuramic acid kinase [Acidithiobacillus sp. GGI-221]